MLHHRHSCPQQLSKRKTRGASLERDGVEGGEHNRDDNEDGWDRRRRIDDNDSHDKYARKYLGGCNCHPPRGRLSLKATGVFVRRHFNAIFLLLLVALFLCLGSSWSSLISGQPDTGRSLQRIQMDEEAPLSPQNQITDKNPCSSAESLSIFLRQARAVDARKFSSNNPVCPEAAQHMIHVAIPVYNLDESTLKAALTSVKTQDYPKFTVWVYDDESTRRDSIQALTTYCDEIFQFTVPLDNTGNKWEGLLDKRLSNLQEDPSSGQVLCFRSDRHLGASGGLYWLLKLVRASSNPNDVVTILSGERTLRSKRALETINREYIDSASWFVYGSHEGRKSDYFADLLERREQPGQITDLQYLTLKAHLLDHISIYDFKYSDGNWLGEGDSRGFVYRLVELSGPDRIGHIPLQLFRKDSRDEFHSKEVRNSYIRRTAGMKAPKEHLKPDIHVILLVWKRVRLLKFQLDSLQAQTDLGGRRIHLHLLNNNPEALESVENATKMFTSSHGIDTGDGSSDSPNNLPPMKISITQSFGTMQHIFARFTYVDELRRREQLDEVIMVDDDQYWPRDFISSLLKAHHPKSTTSWYGKTFEVGKTGLANYWAPNVNYMDLVEGAHWPEVSTFTYGGPGGSIFDANLWLLGSQIMRLERDLSDWNMIDDLWSSYVLDALLGWAIRRLEPPHMPIDIGHFCSNQDNKYHSKALEYMPPDIAMELMMESCDEINSVAAWKLLKVEKNKMFQVLQERFMWNVHTADPREHRSVMTKIRSFVDNLVGTDRMPIHIRTTPPVVLLPDNESSRQTKPQTAALSSLPKWVTGTPEDFAFEMTKGSRGLTDKVDERHLFQYIYQPNLARLIQHKLDAAKSLSHSPLTAAKPKIRMLEFGLGCAPGGGMIRGSPGGSAFGWRHLFDQVEGINFELHVFEFDRDCTLKWHNANPNIAEIHIGDASSEKDLMRAFEKSGGIPFDVIIDDASHINWHQIKTLDFMLPKVAVGGLYIVEDIQSSCRDWKANMGSHRGDNVGGTKKCMSTHDGKTTILAHLMKYQRHLIGQYDGFKDKREFLKGVTRIEINVNSALLSKEVQHASD